MKEQVRPPAAVKSSAYRERKRAAGLRQVRLWVPDLRSPVWRQALERERAANLDTADARAWTDAVEADMATWDDWRW